MTTTTGTTSPTRTRVTTPALWRPGLLAAVGAAAATTAIAAVAHAAGVSLLTEGEQIPLLGFAQLTVMFSVIGILIAAALRRWAGRPRIAFVRTTVVLTALSLVPDLMVSAAAGTRVTLMAAHLVAAAIVITAVAKRLR